MRVSNRPSGKFLAEGWRYKRDKQVMTKIISLRVSKKQVDTCLDKQFLCCMFHEKFVTDCHLSVPLQDRWGCTLQVDPSFSTTQPSYAVNVQDQLQSSLIVQDKSAKGPGSDQAVTKDRRNPQSLKYKLKKNWSTEYLLQHCSAQATEVQEWLQSCFTSKAH